jgi:hypothetical protein
VCQSEKALAEELESEWKEDSGAFEAESKLVIGHDGGFYLKFLKRDTVTILVENEKEPTFETDEQGHSLNGRSKGRQCRFYNTLY